MENLLILAFVARLVEVRAYDEDLPLFARTTNVAQYLESMSVFLAMPWCR